MTQIVRRVVVLLLLVSISGVLQPLIARQAAEPFGLRITAVQEGGLATPVRQLSTQPPVVVVQDRNGRPVANAIVVFTAPASGPSGVFEDGSRSVTVTTDQNGRAVGLGYRANATAGSYQIQVRAQLLNETANGIIGHTNTAGRSTGKLIAILAAVGGAAIGVAAASGGGGGGGNNGSSPGVTPSPGAPPSATPTISFGGSTVGAPNR